MCKRNPNCVHALLACNANPTKCLAACIRNPCVLRYRSPQLRLTPLYNPDPPSKSPSSEGDFCRAPCALRVEPAGKRRIPEWSVERAYATRVSCGTECRNGENLGAPGRIHALPVCLAVPNAAATAYAVVQFRLHPNPSRGRGFCRAPCALRVEPAKQMPDVQVRYRLTPRPLPLHLAKRRKGLRGRKPAARYFNRISSSRYPAPPIRSMTNST